MTTDTIRLATPGRAPWWLALLVSLAAGAVGLVWRTAPESYPYGSGDIVTVGFNHLIEREAGTTIALTAAALGIVAAAIGLLGRSRTARRFAAAIAVVQVLCFAFVLGDGAIVAAFGYLFAVGAPIGAVVLLVLVGRRWPRAAVAMVAAAVVLVAVELATGALLPVVQAYGRYLVHLATSNGGYYQRLLWTLGWLAGAACWVWVAVVAAGGSRRSRETSDVLSALWARPAAVRRWGRVATVVAALCPVPYGLARLTWVTPWPLGGGPAPEQFVISWDLDLGTRLQGFLFAPAVAVGVILTLGLISRWGEVFPRWVPGLAGQAVPVKLAVIPGTLMAAVFTLAAPGMAIGDILAGDPLQLAMGLFFFPFGLWGPALGAAVFAYWLRRTQPAESTADPRSDRHEQSSAFSMAPAEGGTS